MTLDELAAEMGYQPGSIRAVINYLRVRFPNDPIDEQDITPAVEATIRDTVAGVEIAVRLGCPELH